MIIDSEKYADMIATLKDAIRDAEHNLGKIKEDLQEEQSYMAGYTLSFAEQEVDKYKLTLRYLLSL